MDILDVRRDREKERGIDTTATRVSRHLHVVPAYLSLCLRLTNSPKDTQRIRNTGKRKKLLLLLLIVVHIHAHTDWSLSPSAFASFFLAFFLSISLACFLFSPSLPVLYKSVGLCRSMSACCWVLLVVDVRHFLFMSRRQFVKEQPRDGWEVSIHLCMLR